MELKTSIELSKKYPKYIMNILDDELCDLGYGILLLLDYKSKKYTKKQIIDNFKLYKENKNGKVLRS